MKVVCDTVHARGHSMITGKHRNTIEITKDEYVTERGTCIIACSSDKAVKDLNSELRELLKNDNTIVIVKIITRNLSDIVICRGSKNLKLSNDRKIIIRRSRYVDDSTLCIEANKASIDIDRKIISMLCMCEEVTIKICAIDVSDILNM